MDNWGIAKEAAVLHRDACVLDMSKTWVDVPTFQEREETLVDVAANGCDFVCISLAHDWEGLALTISNIAKDRAWFEANSDRFVLISTADDILKAKQEGKLAVAFLFQGANPLDGNTDMVELYYKLGVRTMLIAYNMKNAAGDGCMERTDGGLSRFGVAVVEEMNRVGMIVDGTHTGYRTTMDMFEVSKDPVNFSHSNPWGPWNHPRNIRDDQIKACARSGGVVGIMGVGTFLGNNDISIETFIRHIDYVAELVGPEHVGLGLDYFHNYKKNKSASASVQLNPIALHEEALKKASGGKPSVAWDDIDFFPPSSLPKLTEGLMKNGHTEAEIRGILGENWLRVARRVWK